MKRTIVATMLAMLFLLMMPATVSAAGVAVESKTGDGTWEGSTWKVGMFPGETKATTLTLYNSSSSTLDVEVTIIPDSLDNGNLIFELDKSRFAMLGKSRIGITLTVSANGSATPGIYATELTIKSEIPPAPVYISGGGGGGGSKDRSPPRISSITLYNVNATTADICWNTNEASTSQVEYWTSPSKLSPLDKTYVTKHRVQLVDLIPNTAYSYKTMSEDKAGNLKVSEEYTFTTLKEVVEPVEPIPPKPEELKPIPEPEPKPEPAPEPDKIIILEPIPTAPEVLPEPTEGWIIQGFIVVAGVGLIATGILLWVRKRRAR